MKNLGIAVGGIVIVALLVWGASTFMKPVTTDTATPAGQAGVMPGTTTEVPPVVYQCADSKSLSAIYTEGSAALSLSDGRSNIHMVRAEVPNDDGSEVKFVSDNGAVTLWVHDFSAFVEEGGATTYASCTVSANTYQ